MWPSGSADRRERVPLLLALRAGGRSERAPRGLHRSCPRVQVEAGSDAEVTGLLPVGAAGSVVPDRSSRAGSVRPPRRSTIAIEPTSAASRALRDPSRDGVIPLARRPKLADYIPGGDSCSVGGGSHVGSSVLHGEEVVGGTSLCGSV